MFYFKGFVAGHAVKKKWQNRIMKVRARFFGGIKKSLPPNQLLLWPKSPPPNCYHQISKNLPPVYLAELIFRYCQISLFYCLQRVVKVLIQLLYKINLTKICLWPHFLCYDFITMQNIQI